MLVWSWFAIWAPSKNAERPYSLHSIPSTGIVYHQHSTPETGLTRDTTVQHSHWLVKLLQPTTVSFMHYFTTFWHKVGTLELYVDNNLICSKEWLQCKVVMCLMHINVSVIIIIMTIAASTALKICRHYRLTCTLMGLIHICYRLVTLVIYLTPALSLMCTVKQCLN